MTLASPNLAVSQEVFDRIVAWRRSLHQQPELSGQEHRSSAFVCSVLTELGIAHRQVAGTGVIGEVPARADGVALDPQDGEVNTIIALRADLDALPIHEETGLPFASQHDGVMHACGHDAHTSMLLGAATLLAEEPNRPAPVRLIFQPSEEVATGAKTMIEHGALDDVAMIFGGHVDRHYPAGKIVISDGAVNASSDRFTITIDGRGGHAARPHEALDAVVTGSLIVVALQTIVSRGVDPAHPSVVTVGRFDGGTAGNVIAGRATLQGSIRAQQPEVRDYLHESVRRIATSTGAVHGAHVEVEITKGAPSLHNTPDMANLAREAAREAVGAANVQPMSFVNMGAEDFAYYLEHVRGCYVRIGAAYTDRDNAPAHSSKFDIDERAMAAGAAYYHSLALIAGEKLVQPPSVLP